MYECLVTPGRMVDMPCNRACEHYWECVDRCEEQDDDD